MNITIPQKGEQAQLVKVCRSSTAGQPAQQTGRTGRGTSALDEPARLLGLENLPQCIESCDTSNLAGGGSVTGMVVFENGRPLRSACHRFQIRGFEGQDDYGAMRKVIGRHLGEYYQHKDGGGGSGRLSDLVLLDGGKGRVSAVHPALQQYGLETPLFSTVKDDKYRTHAIAEDGGETSTHSNRSAFTLVSTIQDEVHRFATGYHRQTRKKSIISNTLTGIPDVGNTRARALLRHFRTIIAVRGADLEQLCGVKGMTCPAMQAIYEYFHLDSGEKDSG